MPTSLHSGYPREWLGDTLSGRRVDRRILHRRRGSRSGVGAKRGHALCHDARQDAVRRRHDAVDERELDEFRAEEFAPLDAPAMRLVDDEYLRCDEPLPPGIYVSTEVDEWVDDSDEDGGSAVYVRLRTRRVVSASAVERRGVVRAPRHRRCPRGARRRRAVRRGARRARGGRDGPARSADEGRERDDLATGFFA
jgi:hypothetical protein